MSTPLELANLSRQPKIRSWPLTLAFALIYLAFLPPGIYSVDGNAMLAVAESLVTHHGFTVPESLGTPGVGGQMYSHWYPLLSILAVPFVFAAQIASRITHLPFHYLAAIFSLPLVCLLTAATAGLVALLAERLGATSRTALISAVSFAFGTVALAYGRTFYAEALLAFLTAAALYFAFGSSRRDLVWAACFVGLAVLAKPTGVILGPILAAYLFFTARRIASVLISGGTVIGTALYLGYNVLRFGTLFNFGIGSSPFGLRFIPAGVLGLIFSPGYGLLWYCPAVILTVFGAREGLKRFKPEILTILCVFLGFLLLHSALPYWFAAWSWGPRYLVPTIPGLCALAGLVNPRWTKALVALTVLGLIANAPTLLCFYERYYAELNDQHLPTEATLAWSFQYAPVLHEWPAAIRQVQDARHADVRELLAQRGDSPASTVSSSRALRVVALWWWVLPAAHIPRALGALVSLAMVVAGIAILWKQAALLRRLESPTSNAAEGTD